MSTGGLRMNLQVRTNNKQILAIALPIAASIVVPQINFIINNIFLSGLGQQELGVAGITGVYYLIFAVVGQGLNNGLQALISRRAGENRLDQIGALFTQGIRISMLFAVLGILVTWLLAPYLFRFALHDEHRVAMAVDFLSIRIMGLPFLYVYQMRNALLVGTNQSRLLIIGTAVEAMVNVIFDYGLIYGKFGMPQLGFNGAAYASILAEIAGLVVLFVVIRAKGISKELHLFQSWKYDKTNSRLILRISFPVILQFAISLISWEFFYILIEHHGQLDLAISNTMRNIFGFFGCFTWAFGATTNSMVSNVIGQGMHDKVHELVVRIMKLSVGFALFVCLFLNLFPHTFLSIYGQGPEFIEAAIPVLRVISGGLVLMAVSVVWLNAVTGTGNTRVNLYSEMAAILFYCVYVYLVLEYWHMPIVWGWASELIYWGTLLLPSFIFMYKGYWRTKSTL